MGEDLKISEELNERFGKLGLYLIEKAKKDIKRLNQQSLIQKAQIKKTILEKSTESSLKKRKQFNEMYNQFLNDFLTSSFLKVTEKTMNLKNNLIKELEKNIFKLIEKKIESEYSNYINSLIKSIKEIRNLMDQPSESFITFNSRDYNYFLSNKDKIDEYIKNKFEIKNVNNDYIGGFKVFLAEGGISYDFTIENHVKKNSSLIQMELSKQISDSEILKIQQKFENFIQNKRIEIEDYLKQYDSI